MRSLTIILSTLCLASACGANRPDAAVATAARPTRPASPPMTARAILTTGYRSEVLVEQTDSIVLALPGGGEQVQVLRRRLRFGVVVDRDGAVDIQLDSMASLPAPMGPRQEVTGSRWKGRLSAAGLVEVESPGTDPLSAYLTEVVISLFPAVPRGGAGAGEEWADTSATKRQVEIFAADDQRRSEWSVGLRTRREGIEVIPLEVREGYEQVGGGLQAGREMQMSAQGSRTATYYLTIGGRIDGMSATDSAQRLITIPSTRQAIPTTQVTKTVTRWWLVR